MCAQGSTKHFLNFVMKQRRNRENIDKLTCSLIFAFPLSRNNSTKVLASETQMLNVNPKS